MNCIGPIARSQVVSLSSAPSSVSVIAHPAALPVQRQRR